MKEKSLLGHSNSPTLKAYKRGGEGTVVYKRGGSNLATYLPGRGQWSIKSDHGLD
jgi:hypothetical protein